MASVISPRQMCSITQLRKELDFQTLEERRLQQRLTFLAINGEIVVTTDDLGLEVTDIRTRAARLSQVQGEAST